MCAIKLREAFISGYSFIHELTNVFGYTHLRIEIKSFDGQEGYAEYSFLVDDESLQYMIHITWISGNIGGKNVFTNCFATLYTNQDKHVIALL